LKLLSVILYPINYLTQIFTIIFYSSIELKATFLVRKLGYLFFVKKLFKKCLKNLSKHFWEKIFTVDCQGLFFRVKLFPMSSIFKNGEFSQFLKISENFEICHFGKFLICQFLENFKIFKSFTVCLIFKISWFAKFWKFRD